MQTVLVTGAAGFIGSHVCVALLRAGFAVLGVDSLVNSKLATVARIASVAGRAMEFAHLDVCDTAGLAALCRGRELAAAIHLAGLKSAPESMLQPQRYLDCNVGGARSLLKALQPTHCRRLVFSSSACVYGRAVQNPVSEAQTPCPDHPYAQSKVEIEQQLVALVARDPSWRVRVLRYFNPLGAHHSGLLGEDPPKQGDHLMPRLLQVASGARPVMPVLGLTHASADGSCLRDFVHVMDLAEGHLRALHHAQQDPCGFRVYNLGAGRGISVLQLIKVFESSVARAIPWQAAPARLGDIAISIADCRRAQRELGWRCDRSLQQMCADAWRFYLHLQHGLQTHQQPHYQLA